MSSYRAWMNSLVVQLLLIIWIYWWIDTQKDILDNIHLEDSTAIDALSRKLTKYSAWEDGFLDIYNGNSSIMDFFKE